jgi:hypothetical protein
MVVFEPAVRKELSVPTYEVRSVPEEDALKEPVWARPGCGKLTDTIHSTRMGYRNAVSQHPGENDETGASSIKPSSDV